MCGKIEGRNTWNEFWKRQTKSRTLIPTIIRLGRSYFSRVYVNFIKKYHLGTSILEAGCGSAESTLQLVNEVKNLTEVALLDFAPQSISVAKRNSRLYGVNADCLIGDTELMPFKSSSFDFVWNMGLLEHFEDPVPIIKEMERVTKNKGKVTVIVPFRYSPLVYLSAIFSPVTKSAKRYEEFQTWEETRRLWSPEELQRKFEEAGLKNIEVRLVPGSFLLTVAVVGEKAGS